LNKDRLNNDFICSAKCSHEIILLCGYLFIIVASLLFTKTEAQINYASLSFQLSLPQGDYKQTYPKTGTGFLFDIVHQLQDNSFIGAGGEAGFMQLNHTDEIYNGYYQNKYNTYHVGSTSYIFSIAPKLRVNFPVLQNTMKIFLDFSVGTNIFFTSSGISHDKHTFFSGIDPNDFSSKLIIDSSSSHSYWALRAGCGAGTEMLMGKKKKLAFIFKFSYLYGGNAKYFSHPDIQNLQITLVPQESKTSMLLAEAGIRFKIFHKK